MRSVAAALGAGFFFVAWAVYYLVRKRDGLGFGDMVLMAMVGTFLGLKLTVLVIFLAPVIGNPLRLVVDYSTSCKSRSAGADFILVAHGAVRSIPRNKCPDFAVPGTGNLELVSGTVPLTESGLSMSVESRGHLFQVMTPVNLMEATPLLRGERPQHRMAQNPRRFSKSFFRVHQHGIHGHQRIIETAQWIRAEARAWNGMLRSLNASRETSQTQNIDAPHLLLQSSSAPLDCPGLCGAKQTPGGGGVRQRQVLQQLYGAPLSIRGVRQRIGGRRTSGAFGFASYEFQFRRQGLQPG